MAVKPLAWKSSFGFYTMLRLVVAAIMCIRRGQNNLDGLVEQLQKRIVELEQSVAMAQWPTTIIMVRFLNEAMGYHHQRVNHSKGEYARGEVHVNTVEGLWSLLRDHLRVHRGVSKLYLPLYIMRFEFLVNHRGKNRWDKMLALTALACQADGIRLRRLGRKQQVHTACPILGLGQVV